MAYKKALVFLVLFMKSITVFGMEKGNINETVPLLAKDPSSFLNQPGELTFRTCLALEKIQDVMALQSTCKTVYSSCELRTFTQFVSQLRAFQKQARAAPSFFNEDQQAHVSQLVEKIIEAKQLMHIIFQKAKVYERDGNVPSWAKLYHNLQSQHLAFECDLKKPSHPFYSQILSLNDHNLIFFPSEKKRINDVIIEFGANPLHEVIPFWKRVVHTIGRNRKTVILGTIALGTICIVGTYYLMQHPPFDSQSFIAAYDSTQTGQVYRKYSYGGWDLPYSIIHLKGCMPKGNDFWWADNGRETCEGASDYYMYQDPYSRSGVLRMVCNKTALDAATFLNERCGFNIDFWYSRLNPFSDKGYYFESNGFYCNLHPSNQSLVCASLGGTKQLAIVRSISEISLADVGQYYRDCYKTQASLYGGFMGTLTFTFLGFLLWSWWLG